MATKFSRIFGEENHSTVTGKCTSRVFPFEAGMKIHVKIYIPDYFSMVVVIAAMLDSAFQLFPLQEQGYTTWKIGVIVFCI